MSQGAPKQNWVAYKPNSEVEYQEFRDYLYSHGVVGYLLQGYGIGTLLSSSFHIASSLDPKFAGVPTYTDGEFGKGFIESSVIVAKTKEEYLSILKGRLNF